LAAGAFLLACVGVSFYAGRDAVVDTRTLVGDAGHTAIIQMSANCAAVAKTCAFLEQNPQNAKLNPTVVRHCGWCKYLDEQANSDEEAYRRWEHTHHSEAADRLKRRSSSLSMPFNPLAGKKKETERETEQEKEPEEGWEAWLQVTAGGRCAGKPPFGWANLGKGLTLKECQEKCVAVDGCKHVSYQRIKKACTQWTDCDKLEESGSAKENLEAWTLETYDDKGILHVNAIKTTE